MLHLTLTHAPNPDIPGGYWDDYRPAPNPATVRVRTIDDAKHAAERYIHRNRLGAGNWTGGTVRDDSGEIIGRIAYNLQFFGAPHKEGEQC